MPKLQDLVRRRKSIRNIRKITKTMELIATSRFKKAFDRATNAGFYTKAITSLAAEMDAEHPFLIERPIKRSLLLVVTSDKGLCGGYNNNILKVAIAHANDSTVEVIGKRGAAYFRFQGIQHTLLQEKMGDRYMNLFLSGEVDRVQVAYTKFSIAKQTAMFETLLPFSILKETAKDYEFLPSSASIVEELMPLVFKANLARCILDATASEQNARRIAMRAATENADELVKTLTRKYNRTRQANITKEISELIAGSMR